VLEEIDRAGLRYQVTARDTVIQGTWEEVLPALGRAHRRLRKRYDRVFLSIEVGSARLLDRAGVLRVWEDPRETA
jgi:uncharacterized protein YqgV (UPF0045/DUF77 family)